MRIHRTVLLFVLLAAVAALTCGCPGLAPGSRAYAPLPKWEAQFFSQARRDVFPNDVRQRPDDFTNVLVAWTGIITNIGYYNDDVSRVARFDAEHHYYDWREDFSVEGRRFFLSPRGEGAFTVFWRAETPEQRAFVDQFAVGDFLIAYGYPSQRRGETIGFIPTQNLRAIKPHWYRTNALEYGRPGEPVKPLERIDHMALPYYDFSPATPAPGHGIHSTHR